MKKINPYIKDLLLQQSSGANYYVILEFLIEQCKRDVGVDLTQEQIANALHLTRPTVRKALTYFAENGYVATRYGRIVVNKEDILI